MTAAKLDEELLDGVEQFIADRNEPPNGKMSYDDAVNVIVQDWLMGQGYIALLSPKAVELMKPLPVFVDCDGPRPDEVEQFLGAGDDFDPDDLGPQVFYPAVIEHWIAHEFGGMNGGMLFEPVAEFALRV